MTKGKKGFQKGHEQFNSGRTHFKKGMTPWNKGMKVTDDKRMKRFVESGHESRRGNPSWNKGLTKETDDRVRINAEKVSKALTGRKLSEELVEKMKGRTPWNKLEERTPYPYEFNNQLKEQIRERDNYECKLCFISQEELNEKLIVHHIDFDKQNNSELNLISLCRSCHGKLNCANKMFWINFFQSKLIIKFREVKNGI